MLHALKMKHQASSCHLCKTSLNQQKREFMPCTQCPLIICRKCFGNKLEATWEEVTPRRETWICPTCEGICPCVRCRKKMKTLQAGDEYKSSKIAKKTSSTAEKYFKRQKGDRSFLFIDETKKEHRKKTLDDEEGETKLKEARRTKLASDAASESKTNLSDREDTNANTHYYSSQLEKLENDSERIVNSQLLDIIQKEKKCLIYMIEMEHLLVFMTQEGSSEVVKLHQLIEEMKKEKEILSEEKRKIISSLGISESNFVDNLEVY